MNNFLLTNNRPKSYKADFNKYRRNELIINLIKIIFSGIAYWFTQKFSKIKQTDT